jgi:probable F420-dependent oxidoreductase
MHVGIMFANTGLLGTAEGAEALAKAADASGVESVWTVEHVVVPDGYESEYPYSKSGRMPGTEDMPFPDPLVWLTWVGAHSTQVRLATGILILPQRNPLVLAKETATLDMLSDGRLTLGIGVGWLEEEFEAIGVPFAGRGRRTEDYVGALRALWTQNPASYESETVAFSNLHMHPKPAQANIPVVVGGHTKSAAERAGRIGDGFFPAKPRNLAELIEVMRSTAEAAGRDADAVEVTTGGLPTPEAVAHLESLGVTRMVLPPPAMRPDDIGPGLAGLMDRLAG